MEMFEPSLHIAGTRKRSRLEYFIGSPVIAAL